MKNKILYMVSLIFVLALTFLLISCQNDTISVDEDGYLIVNDNKTEYKVHLNDEVNVSSDGYVVVNGTKTGYKIEEHKPEFVVKTINPTCTSEGYDEKTCSLCGLVQKVNYKNKLKHSWKSEYEKDVSGHWTKCAVCGTKGDINEHLNNGENECSVCSIEMGSTFGIVYNANISEGYSEVIEYNGTSKHVIIANEYNNLPVKRIYIDAFRNKTIKTVSIPDSVTEICGGAFEYCEDLEYVIMSNNVEKIGASAFAYCKSLEAIAFPDSLHTIDYQAFSNCWNLKTVSIGKGIKSIGVGAFIYCSDLKEITIGDGIVTVHRKAFEGCDRLEYLVENGCKYLGSEENPYAVLVGVENNNFTQYPINERTRTIAGYAFYACNRVTEIVIPDSVKGISANAFYECNALKKVTIGTGVTALGYQAFNGCGALDEVIMDEDFLTSERVLSGSMKNTFNNAFYNSWPKIEGYCMYIGTKDNPYFALISVTSDSCRSYTINEQTKVIAGKAFEECDDFKEVIIPDSVEKIGSRVFYDVYFSFFVLGKGVKSIADDALVECDISSSSLSTASYLFYKGTSKQWEALGISKMEFFADKVVCYYSETQPTTSGKYWRYSGGKPTRW